MRLFIQESAEGDILRQIEWYTEQGLPEIALRFGKQVRVSAEALLSTPYAGSPKKTTNPNLQGLRAWPVKGFDEHRIYYLVRQDVLQIIRVLHGKRDIGPIIQDQTVEDSDAQ